MRILKRGEKEKKRGKEEKRGEKRGKEGRIGENKQKCMSFEIVFNLGGNFLPTPKKILEKNTFLSFTLVLVHCLALFVLDHGFYIRRYQSMGRETMKLKVLADRVNLVHFF